MSSQQHLTLPSLEHWRVSCYTKLNIQATIQDHFCLITTGPSDPRQGPDGLECWWHWPLSPAAQLANYHPPTRQETARPAINTAACNLLPASCCFISAPPLRAAGGSSGDGQIKIGVSDMPSTPCKVGPPPDFLQAPLGHRRNVEPPRHGRHSRAHRGAVRKTLGAQGWGLDGEFHLQPRLYISRAGALQQTHACEHTRLIINSFPLLLLKKCGSGWGWGVRAEPLV